MESGWVIWSLLSAFFLATSDALAKKAVSGRNEYLAASFRLLFTAPVLVPVLFFVPLPTLDRPFWTAFLIALPIEAVTVVLYIKALKRSPMSLTLPFLSLTPVFLIANAFFILGEQVTLQGGTGIALIAIGGYLLNIGDIRQGISGPVRSLLREPGVLLMIAVAFLYSFTSSLGKMAISHSSPLFFAGSYFLALNAVILPVGLWKGRRDLRQFLSDGSYRLLVAPGISYGLMVVTHMIAMSLTKVAYMISVKRTSLLIGVLYGALLFREESIRSRFAGAVIMLAGFVLVVTAG